MPKPTTTFTVVKLCDNERRPAHAICMIEGYCCFERAYQLGRLDEREQRPFNRAAKQPRSRPAKKTKP